MLAETTVMTRIQQIRRGFASFEMAHTAHPRMISRERRPFGTLSDETVLLVAGRVIKLQEAPTFRRAHRLVLPEHAVSH